MTQSLLCYIIMTNNQYTVYFYKDSNTGNSLVKEYIAQLPFKQKTKVLKYIEFLRVNRGYLDEPYSKHIQGKIRELRVDFSKDKHRIFYFAFVGKKIILLHAFLKKSKKTPKREVNKAINNYNNFINFYKYA